jgi:hypothetical protein
MNPWITLAIVLSVTSLWALAILAGRAERKLDRAIGELVRMRIEIERVSGGGSTPIREQDLFLADVLAPPPEPRRREKPQDLTDEHEYRLTLEGKTPDLPDAR